MRELNYQEVSIVNGGIIFVIAGGIAAYYGEKAGRWIYKKIIAE